MAILGKTSVTSLEVLNQIKSNVATGTAPLAVNSTTVVSNLNADYLDGYHATTASVGNTVVIRTSEGYINTSFINTGIENQDNIDISAVYYEGYSDKFIRKCSPVRFRNYLISPYIKGAGATTVTTDSTTGTITISSTNTDSATTQSGHYTPSATASTVGATSGNNYIRGINLDSKKHVISVSTGTPTDTNTWRPVYNGVDSTDTSSAATANAVKTAYDKAVSAYNLANGKTSNVGTVTSVKVTGGTGLSGGGTVTSSGTITLNHAAAYTGTSLTKSTSGANYYLTGVTLTMDGLGHVTGISGGEAYDDDANTNYYLTGVSGSGNGTVTFTRQGLGSLTWDASHTHSEYSGTGHTHSYLPLSGGEMANQNLVKNLNADLLDGYTGSAYSKTGHTHSASAITGGTNGYFLKADSSGKGVWTSVTIPTIPGSLPANGGNADTVDNKHASDFAAASHTHDGYVSTAGGSVVAGTTNFNKIQISGAGATYGTGATLFFGDSESEVYLRNTADTDLTIYAKGTLKLSGGSVTINGSTPSMEGHTHSNYALSGHTHSQYALSGHTHDGYLAYNEGMKSLVLSHSYTSAVATTASTTANKVYLNCVKRNLANTTDTVNGYTQIQGVGSVTVYSDTAGVLKISGSSSSYTLPNATATQLGGIKVGSFLTASSGSLSVSTGTTSSTVARGDHSHSGYSPTGHTHSEYLTSQTDYQVKSQTSSDKIYLLGTNVAQTITGTTYKNLNIYMSGSTTANSTLFVPRISATTISASTAFYQSDERLKDFCGEIDVDFEKLKEIPKKYYTWKSDENKELQIGTSAQKVLEVYPELVGGSEDTNYAVDYARLSIVALKAIDKLHDENQMLRDLVEKMDKRITEMEEKLK